MMGAVNVKSGSDLTGLERLLRPCVGWKVPRSVVREDVGSYRMVTNILNQTGHTADAK